MGTYLQSVLIYFLLKSQVLQLDKGRLFKSGPASEKKRKMVFIYLISSGQLWMDYF